MTRVRLLHLSDVHFHAGAEIDSSIVIEALIRDLGGQEPVDALLFGGDLVLAGCSDADFDSAFDNAIIPVASAIGLATEEIFIAPGNHDICREKVRAFPALQGGLLSQLQSTESVNRFLDHLNEGRSEETLAIERLAAFNSFIKRRLPHQEASNPLVSLGRLKRRDKEIGIAC